MSAASPAVTSAAIRIDSTNGSAGASLDVGVDQPMSNSRPRVKAAASSAPMPANAIWPSDSWPAQPVRTVSDSAQMAKARIMA